MFQTRIVNTLEKAMNGSSLRQTVISNNIANVNAPGYKRSEVSFREALEKSLESEQPASDRLKRTRAQHLPLPAHKENMAVITEESNTSLRNDGNNVDIDREMSDLAGNNIYFNGLAQLLNSQLSLLRTAISEGKR